MRLPARPPRLLWAPLGFREPGLACLGRCPAGLRVRRRRLSVLKFVMCRHQVPQQVVDKAIWEGSRGIMTLRRHKSKEWFRGLREVTVDWLDLRLDASCFRDEGGTPRSPGRLGTRVFFFWCLGGYQEGLGRTDFTKSHVETPPQDHRTRQGRCSTTWSKQFSGASPKTKSHAPPCVISPHRSVGMNQKGWKGPCFSCS